MDDVVILQVAAALLDAPRPSGPRRSHQHHQARNEQALALARAHVRDRPANPDLQLIITPDGAGIAENLIGLMNALSQAAAVPLLLLPLGAWIAALPALSTDRVAS
ncbi:MAG: hypothetical protein ACOH1Y_17510 [Propionicimonas sp.]